VLTVISKKVNIWLNFALYPVFSAAIAFGKVTAMQLIIVQVFANKVFRSYLVILVILFLITFLLKKGDDILIVNGAHSPLLDAFFAFYTSLGDGIIFVPLIIFLLFVRFQYAIAGLLIALLNGILVSIFKRLLFHGAPRPRSVLGDSLIHFVQGVPVHSFNSFPSGHTATAFCFALFIAYLCRNSWVTFFSLVYALLIGYSRIYLAQHFLIDVAAGAIVGSFATFALCVVFELNQGPKWFDNRMSLRL
jgi:membrane-associated phospholipid phosphatase